MVAKASGLFLLAFNMSKNIVFFLAFLLGAFVFLAHWWVVGSAVWGDGRYYYSYVRSLVIDGDLDFKNEIEYFGEPVVLTKTGRVANKYSIGPAIFWLPGFLLAHLIARGDGYSHIYQVLVGLNSVFWGVFGLWFCWRTARQYFSKNSAFLAVMAVWLGTNLFFYTAVDPINSHSVSFFVASSLVYLTFGKELGGLGQLGMLGLLVGILGMIRTQDLIFALPVGIWILKKKINFIKIIIFITFIILGILPQILVWKYLYGEFRSPYLIGTERFNLLNPQIFGVLFSRNNGLFYYSPILILGILGMLGRLGEWWAWAGILLFLFQTYIVGSWHSWYGGAAYGGRMFISLMPFFILGLAATIRRFKKIKIINFIIIISLIILNFYSMIKFLIISP